MQIYYIGRDGEEGRDVERERIFEILLSVNQ